MVSQGDELLTPREVAEELRLSYPMVCRMLQNGKLGYINVSGSVDSKKPRRRVERSELERFKQSRRKASAPQRAPMVTPERSPRRSEEKVFQHHVPKYS